MKVIEKFRNKNNSNNKKNYDDSLTSRRTKVKTNFKPRLEAQIRIFTKGIPFSSYNKIALAFD